jgi:hypothetical protein
LRKCDTQDARMASSTSLGDMVNPDWRDDQET